MDLNKVKGLSNLGNSCFMNSALQCLAHIKPLAKLVLESAESSNEKQTYQNFKEFLKSYYNSNSHVVTPTNLFRTMKNINSRMTPGRQHDAHEYMLGIVDFVENHFKKSKQSEKFEKVFGGRLVSDVTCSQCHHVSSTFENMISLSLVASFPNSQDISKSNNLQSLIQDYFKPDHLVKENRYKCDKCHKKVDATRQYHMDQPPNTVLLHLKRFNYMSKKISKRVDFPETISFDGQVKHKKQNEEHQYALMGVVVHLGNSLFGGHYIAYVRNGPKWFCVG